MQEIGLLDSLFPRSAEPQPGPRQQRVGTPAEFASTYGPAAARAGAALGVDPNVILGQWGLETGWGKSIIPGTNNLGNIKDFSGGGMAATDNMTGSRDRYRAYATPDHFADDYTSLIQRKYPGALNAGADPARFTAGLRGYAEDPRYADKVAQASRMAGAAPSPILAAAGRAVGSLIPTATAAERKTNMTRADASSEEWDALGAKFAPQVAPSALAGSADEWETLAAQFSRAALAEPRPTSAAARSKTASPDVLVTGSGRAGQVMRAMAVPVIGPTLAAFGVDPMRPQGLLAGAASGAAQIGNTLIHGLTNGMENIGAGSPLAVRSPVASDRTARAASLQGFRADNEQRPGFTMGELGTQAAMTFPLGGALAGPVRAVAPLLGRAAPAASAVANAIETGGMRTGAVPGNLLQSAGNMGARILGGATTGAASAGLVNPADAGTGALIGGALPPVVRGMGKAGDLVGAGARALLKPQIASDTQAILKAGGYTAADLPAVQAALGQQGPGIVQAPLTAPQILQNPGISQLSRTLQNSGDTAGVAARQAQDAARMEALNRVSPVTGTRQQAAQNFGNAAGPQIVAGDAAARAKTNRAFQAVDPFNETAFELPLEEMAGQQSKFLGAGTFGMGQKAREALSTARSIGQETLEPVVPTSAKAAKGQPTVFDAVKAAGGINSETPSGQQLAGELNDLRQSGLRGIVNKGKGQSVDLLAQRLHGAGFLPDDDPATLLNALRDHAAGERMVANTADPDRMYRGALEAAQGEAPGAMTVPKAIPFAEVQNLRSSLTTAARKIENSAGGSDKESAALRAMVDDIDARIQAVSEGQGNPREFFPKDMVDQWKGALQSKRDQVATFRTGPQASIFRQGGDNQASAQGAELAPKFFSSRPSQADDIAAFGRVASPQTTNLLKNYAVTDAANQTDALGRLTNSKYNNWKNARSGALIGLFNEGEQATLRGVGSSLRTADQAERLGMATGSNTAQNVQSALGSGLLDSAVLRGVANRTPVIGRFTGPMLDSLRDAAKRGKVERLSGLLADPDALSRAIAAELSRPVRRAGLLDRDDQLLPLLLRASPLLANDR